MSEVLRDLVVSLSLDGDNFSRNLTSINKQIQEAESEFRRAASGVENFEKSVSGTQSQLSSLQQKMALQQKAVKQYERALEAANKKLENAYARQGRLTESLDAAKQKNADLKQQVAAATTAGIADRFGGYVRTRSKLSIGITATGAQGSSISAYRTSIDSVTYSGSSFITNALNTAGNLTMTVTVTDSRGRTASTTRTVTVLDYSPPSLSQFSAERCNDDDSAPQTDGTKVRISAKASGSSVGGKNTLACTVYYKLSSAESWVSAVSLAPSNYAISETNRLLSPTFDALSSYDIKIRVQDVFYYIEQMVSIGTKQVMMDFYKDGSGIAFGKVAENAGKVEFGWPLMLSEPLGVDQGGTGAETASAACTKLGAIKKAGDTMTGNLAISGYLYPSLYLLPTYNSTTNRTVFEGSYVGASSFSSWEDGTGNNRRMLEVRNAAYQASLDFAVLLRTCTGGTWASYRLFHAGMATPIPLANGGTGASSAKAALSNLGIFYSASLPSSGTDGQICLVPV